MPKEQIKWVKQNSPLHKQLTTAHLTGVFEGMRGTLDFLAEQGGIDKDYISWLIEEEIGRKTKLLCQKTKQ